MSKLVDLIESIGRDADLMEAYEKDPDAVMARFDLNEEEKKALRDGDLDAIKRLTGLTNIRLTNSNISTYE